MATILIIDDEPAILRMISRILAKAGHRVVEAGNGPDGIALFVAEPPDLVVIDILMPGKDGIETMRELLAIRPDVHLIAISGGGKVDGDFYLDLADRFGAQAHLAKPFTPGDLLATVAKLLG